jgi:integrin alpha FG-GAP repeat containing protein 1
LLIFNQGFADIIVITSKDYKNHVKLLQNVLCELPTCRQNAVSAQRRMFKLFKEELPFLEEAGNGAAIQAGFFDLGEKGSLDIWVIEQKGNVRKTSFFYNNFYNDVSNDLIKAFFLKLLISNGACDRMCPEKPLLPSHKARGVFSPGATFKFIVMDPNGHNHLATGTQMSQSAYISLSTPYSLVGLGRTNNYIEDLAVGISKTVRENAFILENRGALLLMAGNYTKFTNRCSSI